MSTAATTSTQPRAQEQSLTSPRIQKMMSSVRPPFYPVCIDKARIITESWLKTEGESQIFRVAKAQAAVFDKMPIFIEEGELIVGNLAAKPMGVEVQVEIGRWLPEGIDAVCKEGWGITETERTELLSMMQVWENKMPGLIASELYDERMWDFAQSGVVMPPWEGRTGMPRAGNATSGLGFATSPDSWSLDWEYVIGRGLNSVIADAREALGKLDYRQVGNIKKANFYRAVILIHQALLRRSERFAACAEEMAAQETDATRKQELLEIAANCRWVPANPPRSFHEAMQSLWFIFTAFAHHGPGTMPFARFDQYMYPFYKKDKADGKITDEQVLELLQCLRIKDMQINNLSGTARQREKWAGMAKWNNMVIGGVTADGDDATNELTYLVLEAVKRCPTPHHTVTLRVHDGTPEQLLLKALQVIKTGVGMPAFISDRSYIEYLLTRGVPHRVARNYAVIGCLDATVPESCSSLYGMFIAPLVLDIFIHDGVEPRTGKQIGPKTGPFTGYQTFEDLTKGFQEQLRYFMGMQIEQLIMEWQINKEIYPEVMSASLYRDGMKEGKSRVDCTPPYQMGATVNAVGMINVADSLAAIKKLAFQDKAITLGELKAALDANWAGERNQEIRKMCLAAPKFGNADDTVDLIARDLYQFYADTANTFVGPRGTRYTVGGISITAHGPGGAATGATPDGRYARETLADGSVSPAQGKDTHGPTAVIKSASKINQELYQSTLFNLKFHPTALKTTEDLRKLSGLIRTYFGMGGKQMQFNVVDKKVLLEAQAHPENYRDLIVRVAGYSAYFVQLTKSIQDEVIARTENEQTA